MNTIDPKWQKVMELMLGVCKRRDSAICSDLA